jgi:hypothetical protein
VQHAHDGFLRAVGDGRTDDPSLAGLEARVVAVDGDIIRQQRLVSADLLLAVHKARLHNHHHIFGSRRHGVPDLDALHLDLQVVVASLVAHLDAFLEHCGGRAFELMHARLAGGQAVACGNRSLHNGHVAVDAAVGVFAPFALFVPVHRAEDFVAGGAHVHGAELFVFDGGVRVGLRAECAVVGVVGVLMAADAVDSVRAFVLAQGGMLAEALDQNRLRRVAGQAHLQRAVARGLGERFAFPCGGVARFCPVFRLVWVAALAIATHFGQVSSGRLGRVPCDAPRACQHQRQRKPRNTPTQ